MPGLPGMRQFALRKLRKLVCACPDAAREGEPPEARDLRAQIFARVAAAWATLETDAGRLAYLEDLKSGGTAQVDIGRIYQAEQAFENLRRVLEAGGSGLDKIVKVTIYLTDMANFPKIVELRARYFSQPWPADTIVEVSALALPELEIEIEAVALASA